MRAFVIEADGKLGKGRVVEDGEPSDTGDVTIAVAYAGVNYKDALAGLGGAPIVRRYPCIGGIEAVGQVIASDRPDTVSIGDMVLCHGHGIGVSHNGGFAERLRVPADWAMPIPEGLSPLEAATLGVAGYSAALAIDRLETLGLTHGALPVAVSGATGGVGRFAVAMLAKRGFSVTAVTSKSDAVAQLRAAGATEILSPDMLEDKPVSRARFAGAIDTVGGGLLPRLLSATAPGGAVASIGNAGGISLETTVLPFILRGITLTGINADSDAQTRARIWARLADDLKPVGLDQMATCITLDDLPETMRALLAGTAPSRSVVQIGSPEQSR